MTLYKDIFNTDRYKCSTERDIKTGAEKVFWNAPNVFQTLYYYRESLFLVYFFLQKVFSTLNLLLTFDGNERETNRIISIC